jgi:hypothetical protein
VRSSTSVLVVGQAGGGRALVVEVLHEVVRGSRVEGRARSRQPLARRFARERRELARVQRPIARPELDRARCRGRPFQNGISPGSPGAGSTSTRSWVIATMRQLEAPSTKTSPSRLSNTISSSSSPTRRPAPAPAARKTP